MVGSSAPAGPSGPGEKMGRGQGRGKAATPDCAYPHPRIFALDSPVVSDNPNGGGERRGGAAPGVRFQWLSNRKIERKKESGGRR
ncbi:hypothetical protein HAX54_049177 [Datura stramonium]|uniref:Uncharacterized protein n=1 Tax=Datura stramonium TaxID=4076 RepID=A0ABS8WQ07_DATST|nr:hypothetical protein [Datura stramonium]